MLRFIKTKPTSFASQTLILNCEGITYFPSLQHTAIHQDIPVGDNKTFCEHIHDLYHLVLFTHSEGSYSKCGTVYPAVPGTLVLVWPGQSHDFVTWRKSAVYSEMTFSFESQADQVLRVPFNQMLSLYSGMPITLDDPVELNSEKTSQLNTLLIQLTDYANGSADSSGYLQQRTLGAIFDFLINLSQQQNHLIRFEDHRIHQARAFIESHYTQPLDIQRLAKSIGMSKGYFFRVFKKTFTVSPLSYQQNLRLEAAKTLLRCTTLQGKEIAARCGYDNAFFFCRIFKKYAGCSPLQYRKRFIQIADTIS